MQYPSFGEYADALQANLDDVLSDPVLRRGTLCTRGPGTPAVYGGTYALTFVVESGSRKYAVRCFHKELDSLYVRYGAIERYLAQINSPHFVDCRFQPQGITTESGTYPIVRMDWVEGPTLAAYVADHRADADALLELRFALRRLAMHLRAKGVAHGDIQPSNVVVQGDGTLRLIDYDGLFVPELSPLDSAELGQRNFQHPARRPQHFDANLDVFSFALMDFALRALCFRPDLWELTSSGDDAFLLRAADYADPARSAILAMLARETGFEERTRHLASVCVAPFESIPPLEEFVAGRGLPATVVELSGDPTAHERPPYLPANRVVDAADFAQCCRHVGERIELIGRVVGVARVPDGADGPPNLRVEFGERPCDMACVTIWSDSLPRFGLVPDDAWVGQWVSAVGLLEPVATDRGSLPEQKVVAVAVEEPGQLQRIPEAEAIYRLRSQGILPARSTDPADRVRTDPVAAVDGAQDAGRAQSGPVPARHPRHSRVAWWWAAAALALPVAYLLLSRPDGREPAIPAGTESGAPPVAATVAEPPVEPSPPAAPVEVVATVTEPTLAQDLQATQTTIETVAGTLSILPAADGGCRRIGLPGGGALPDLCADRVEFAHRTVFPDREVIVGFTRCADVEAACGMREPFWLELRPGSPPRLLQVPALRVGSGRPTITASAEGVRIDLGQWDGEQRHATLGPAGNVLLERQRAPVRPLSQSDCAMVARSLEDCAAARDCSSFAGSAQFIPQARWARLVRVYHESTGFDLAAFRTLCVRSCQLKLSPSEGLVRRFMCNGALPGQWQLDDPAAGLRRQEIGE